MSHSLFFFFASVFCLLRFGQHVMGQDTFDWNQITPSDSLAWVPCNTNFECARLTVPLDYKNPNVSTAAIALIRLPAGVPTNSSDYRGPLILGAGGPGGSGVDLVLANADLARAIIGPQFDLVGFDGRGISRSTPRASFFPTQAERAQFPAYLRSLNASEDAFGRAYADFTLQSSLARARDDGSLRFTNTESTARDMLKIVQAHGQKKVQYWGFSIGSVLGTTFAEMFPDKIERLVIDGVMDPEDYYSTSWLTNLHDTNQTWNIFLDGCVAAGPSACALYEPTAAAIQAKVDAFSKQLKTRPIAAITSLSSSTPSYHVVDYSMLRQTIFTALYTPYASFQPLATALHQLSLGNASALYEMSGLFASPYQCPANAAEAAQEEFSNLLDGQVAIQCNDGAAISTDFNDVKAHYEKLCATSPWCDVLLPRLTCLGWPKNSKDNVALSFTANTSFPMLAVSNTADPVTPHANGVKVSGNFPGSVLLTQDSPGHTSIAAPSTCTLLHIAAYFINGTLPASGTICPVDDGAELFPSGSSATQSAS
ncbi:Abhydrolase-4 domain-containing protein [Favolaschia claudopus]|uniref:Abhydrolase-4 domain-containing protein n=1 Tax=Favolaschia claudopus TaxID=2862362 RepID=A0AAV9ZRC2_9AGAR